MLNKLINKQKKINRMSGILSSIGAKNQSRKIWNSNKKSKNVNNNKIICYLSIMMALPMLNKETK